MEGMLCRWALSIQEFNFDITYRKDSLNTNADALSRRDQPHSSEVTALTVSVQSPKQLAQCQQADEVTKKLYDALLHTFRQIVAALPLPSLQANMVEAEVC